MVNLVVDANQKLKWGRRQLGSASTPLDLLPARVGMDVGCLCVGVEHAHRNLFAGGPKPGFAGIQGKRG
jgi:hypothetical protein